MWSLNVLPLFAWDLQLPPTVQKHAREVNEKVACVRACVRVSFQDVTRDLPADSCVQSLHQSCTRHPHLHHLAAGEGR